MSSNLFLRSEAVLSPCQKYRYSLLRAWDEDLPCVCWIMLNPSRADAETDDATIRRVVDFSHSWGYGGCVVVNLFAYRATDPQEMMKVFDPVGSENDHAIEQCTMSRVCVAAWGAHGWYLSRAALVTDRLVALKRDLRCLGLTKDGFPLHPLRLSKKTALRAYP